MFPKPVLRSLVHFWSLGLLASGPAVAKAQPGFPIEQALRAPYAASLSAAREGSRFAWVAVREGRHNLVVSTPGEPTRGLTHYSEDDGNDLRELSWFAGGKWIAFTRGPEPGNDAKPANAAHAQPPARIEVWVAESHGAGEPRLVGEGHSPLPLPDGKQLLFVRSGQLWIADLGATPGKARPRAAERSSGAGGDLPGDYRGAPARQLVFDRGSASGLTLSPDGHTLAFISRRDHNHSFLALFDMERHLLSFPAASTGNDSAPVFSPDGRHLAWLRAPWTEAPEFAANRSSPNPWSIEVLDLDSGRSRTLFHPAANEPGSVLPHLSTGEPRLWWTPQQLLFTSEAEGWVHLYALTPGARDPQPVLLTPGSFEVEDPAVSPDGQSLVYAANAVPPGGDPADADRRHLWFLDLSRPTAKPVLLTPGEGLETHPAFSGDSVHLAALRADGLTPNQPIALATLQAGSKILPLADPRTVSEDRKADAGFATPQPVLFPSADKLFTLHGQLFGAAALPAATASGAARKPALLFFHGGPRRQMLLGFPAMEYYTHAYVLNQYFAARGFVVLSVNYRRGIGYGLDFREAAGTGADGASEYNDVLGAVAYLRSRPDVDPERIGLWGGSYGGYLTALGLARNSELFAAGVDFHGVHDWILEDNRGDWLQGTQAEQAAIAAKAHASSPMADVGTWKSPVLLIHGDNDANVAYAQTPLLADALRARNVPVQELIFPDEIHEFLLYRDWLAAYKASAAFLEEHLQPTPAASAGHP